MPTIITFFLVLGFLVFLHEFGHFVFAKRAGIRVEAFAFGFGPSVFKWKRGDTEYRICPIPIGGYVKMLGEDPKDEGADAVDSYSRKPLLARLKVVTAGPLMNLILPFLLMPAVYMIGIEQPAYLEEPAVVGWVSEGSPGAKAGFLPGDRIVRIDDDDISTWKEAQILFSTNPGEDLSVEIFRDGRRIPMRMTPEEDGYRGGFTGIDHEILPIIGKLSPSMPAANAGLNVGDRVLSINGESIREWAQLSSIVRANPDESINLKVQRGDETFSLDVTPVLDEAIEGGLLGIFPQEVMVLKHYGFWEAIRKGFRNVLDSFLLTFYILGKLLTGGLSIKALGGPILIAKMTGDAVRIGISNLLHFVGFLSVQLGVLNLLPIPVLDGGQVVFLALEAIRKRPVNQKLREISQQASFVLLLGFLLVISYNDIMRVLPIDLGDVFR